MSTDDNSSVIFGFLDLVNAGSLDEFDTAVAPEFLVEEQEFYTSVFKIFPNFHLTVEDMIAQADQVAIRFRVHGTHRGEWRGLAATGKDVSWTGMQWFRLVNGKIVEHLIAANQLDVLEQLTTAS